MVIVVVVRADAVGQIHVMDAGAGKPRRAAAEHLVDVVQLGSGMREGDCKEKTASVER
jgi:hypothetical protein